MYDLVSSPENRKILFYWENPAHPHTPRCSFVLRADVTMSASLAWRCDHCGHYPSEKRCTRCKTPYCSVRCQKADRARHKPFCQDPATIEQKTNETFGKTRKDQCGVHAYDTNFFVLPGPIHGTVPHAMYAVTDANDLGARLYREEVSMDAYTEQLKRSQGLPPAYYFVAYDDLYRVYYGQFTPAQREQMDGLIVHGSGVAQNMAQKKTPSPAPRNDDRTTSPS